MCRDSGFPVPKRTAQVLLNEAEYISVYNMNALAVLAAREIAFFAWTRPYSSYMLVQQHLKQPLLRYAHGLQRVL
jgi:hypothetical protein